MLLVIIVVKSSVTSFQLKVLHTYPIHIQCTYFVTNVVTTTITLLIENQQMILIFFLQMFTLCSLTKPLHTLSKITIWIKYFSKYDKYSQDQADTYIHKRVQYCKKDKSGALNYLYYMQLYVVQCVPVCLVSLLYCLTVYLCFGRPHN